MDTMIYILQIGRETGRQSAGNSIAKLGYFTADLGQHENGRKKVGKFSEHLQFTKQGGVRRRGVCAVVLT